MKNNYKALVCLTVLFFVTSLGFSQSSLQNSSYGSIVLSYLTKEKGNYELTDADIQDLYVNNEVYSKSTGITHLYVQQRFQGVFVHNAVSSIAIKDNRVFYYENNFISNLASKVNTISTSITPQQAVMNAASHLNLGGLSSLDLLDSNGNSEYVFSNGNISGDDIPVKKLFTPTQAGAVKLTWDITIRTNDGMHWWSVRVDAVNGEMVDVADWMLSCNFGETGTHSHSETEEKAHESFSMFKSESYFTDGSQYNVFPLPVESPNHGNRQLVVEPFDPIASPYGWHDTNGVTGAEYTITRGNNVYAQEDTDGTNSTFGAAPNGTASLNFDFPLNLQQAASGYQNASLTNLFYVNNMIHDIMYRYGFDEASGNFQTNNYGNGGAQNDHVIADGQDGSGINNANFATPADGGNPRMQMYLWSPSNLTELITINNGTLAGGITSINPSTASGTDGVGNITGASATPVTGDLILVDDGSAAPSEACSAITNAIAGKIAVIRRGNCNFTAKIQNAQDAGAIGVIMVNHNNPTNDPNYVEYVSMYGVTNPPFTIPSVFVNYTDGEAIIAAMQSETVNATLQLVPTFQRDGSFDNGVVVHEYGHGISNRLTGGPSQANCLQNGEQMGEGWSDFFGYILTMQSTYSGDQGLGFATYAAGQTTSGVGIRPAKYSTDFAENDYTYGDTNNNTIIGTDSGGQPIRWNQVPHNIGFVWATMLWDLTWAYIEKYGFDPDLNNGTGGNNRVLQVVMDGLKLQPCNPGFVQGRNAILVADMALTGGQDQCMIWEVFANRGLGVNASQGFPFSMTDQIEDFTMPAETDPTLANCTTLSVAEFNSSSYKVYPNPTDTEINISVNRDYGQANISLYDINGRTVYNAATKLNGLTKINVANLQPGIYVLNISGEYGNINEKVVIK